MKKFSNFKKCVSGIRLVALAIIAGVSVTACDPTIDSLSFDLPEAGSKADLKPPVASFVASKTLDYLTYTFSNTSSSATDYVWDFGDGGATVTTLEATRTFPDEGTYTVTLTATDKLGQSNSVSAIVEVVKPDVPPVLPPTIVHPNFDVDAEKNSWKAPFRGTMQTTTSNGYMEGGRGGKLPQDGSRAGYQEFDITPNASFTLKYKYRFRDQETSQTGKFYVRIVKPLTITTFDNDVITNNTLIGASATYVESPENTGALLEGSITFNSGSNSRVAILFYNELDECYIDTFTITVNQ
ncbi:PKD domain-containing protein [Mariniflexile sp.]|uniref:PKD domain-containing protein n=1 Tax=Mariniflexile sp. TaxID=1979402 RepID=UPI003567C537